MQPVDKAVQRFADEAVCIGPAPSSESYLKIANIISAAEITNADAIHPGYGFLAENSNFSKICSENNIKFIGASPEMIDGMGDKAAAKETMKKAGVPTIPGSDGLIKDFNECAKLAADVVGYPVMLKATAGGGGKGMRLVWKQEDLEDAWNSAISLKQQLKIPKVLKLMQFPTADALSYSHLCEGKIDVVFQCANKIWDIHPLIPIIKASGGIVTTWNNKDAVNAGSILVSANQSTHNKMLKLLKSVSK